MKLFFSISIALIMCGCAPRVKLKLFESQVVAEKVDPKTVILASIYDSIPEDLEPIGKLKIGDTGFSMDCDFVSATNAAKLAAAESGANVVRVVRFLNASGYSTCVRFRAELYRFSSSQYDKLVEQRANYFPCPQDSAAIYVYRTYDYQGSGLKFKVYLDDEPLGKLRSNTIVTKNIVVAGNQPVIWAKTEAKSELKLDPDRGNSYFVKVSVDPGFFLGRPYLELVSREQAILEIAWIEFIKK